MSEKRKTAVLQDGATSEANPVRICSFDYEAIEQPTKALIHQAARFLYFKRGKGVLTIDGTDYRIVPDTLIAITPWEISNTIEVEEPLQFIRIVYDYQYLNATLKMTRGMEEESAELFQILSSKPCVYLDSVQTSEVDQIMDQLKSELGVESTLAVPPNRPMGALYVTCKIIELMILFRRFQIANSETGYVEEDRPGEQASILSYIYAHSSDKLTLEKLSKVFFMSESSLTKQIAEITGTNFTNVLNNIRIEKACDYLIYTDMKLDEIAKILGFVDASHISKHFTATVGITPNEYRKHYHKTSSPYGRTNKELAFQITDYLYKNYAEDHLNINRVADGFGVSVVEMNRSLLYYTEMNYETLLNYIRIMKASEMLVGTEDSVTSIAVAVGYNNIKTFNQNFFKFNGMTPTEFRKSVTLQHPDGSETASAKNEA